LPLSASAHLHVSAFVHVVFGVEFQLL
jgi:hypothetical protein